MSIKVNIPYFFHHLTNGVKATEVNGSTVGECLKHLVKQFPSIEKAIFDENSKLHSYLEIYINEESAYPRELTKPVKPGDELYILLMVDGG